MEPIITTKSWNHEIESQILKSWDLEDLYSFKLKKNDDNNNDEQDTV